MASEDVYRAVEADLLRRNGGPKPKSESPFSDNSTPNPLSPSKELVIELDNRITAMIALVEANEDLDKIRKEIYSPAGVTRAAQIAAQREEFTRAKNRHFREGSVRQMVDSPKLEILRTLYQIDPSKARLSGENVQVSRSNMQLKKINGIWKLDFPRRTR